MAVHASDVALLDLGLNSGPTTLRSHERNGLDLVDIVAMVELEHDRICLTTADARMSQEICE